ncbi:MAG: hypothetical protein HYY93_16585 [Planctomycetes bacterium]|nr:hypothetical protein [Planctomycetota bacterium]
MKKIDHAAEDKGQKQGRADHLSAPLLKALVLSPSFLRKGDLDPVEFAVEKEKDSQSESHHRQLMRREERRHLQNDEDEDESQYFGEHLHATRWALGLLG